MLHLNLLLYVFWATSIFYPTNADFSEGKLPSMAVPVSYDITLEPNLDEVPATFNGNVTIELKVLEATNNITLHASRLRLSKDVFSMRNSNGEIIPIADVKMDRFLETCTFSFENNLHKNEYYQLTITYSGKLRTDNQGFYLAKYQNENGEERFIATTLFTKTNARSAFPCFDEPALKSQFKIKIIRPENYNALSNEEIISTENLGNGRFLDVFRETCNMSTYLVAFTISQFNHTEKNGLHRVFAKPQDISSGKADYVLKESTPTLEAVEKYVDMKYIFPKIDHIAIPSEYFIGEAMENWGLITYSENTLLFSNNTSTTTDEQTTLTSMLHEFIHQWFGNLVTPSDWNYLWLSEGFATYLQFRIGDIIKPSWKLQDQFQNIVLERALEGENSFNDMSLNDDYAPQWVSYLKAAAIIRMTEHFLTPEVFQKGLQYYLNKNQFGAVDPADLYAAFQTAVDENGVVNLVGHNAVIDIMRTWDSVARYPIVTVTRNYDKGYITLEQNTFIPFEFMKTNNHTWYIPINYVFNTNSAEDFTKTTADYWLTEKMHTLNNTFTTDGWLIVNKQFTGYYRVNYDPTNWDRLIAFLNSPNFYKIHVLNRAQLISDSFELARHGNLDYKIPLSLSTYLLQERDYVPFSSFFNAIELLNKCLITSDIYPHFKNYIIDILSGVHEKLSCDETEEDDHLDKFNRANVASWLCSLGYSKCREVALSKLRNWKTNNSATISPNLQEALLCGAVRIGNQEDWDFLLQQYETADTATERTRILKALSCSENEKILTHFLDKIRDKNSTVFNNSDRTTAIIATIESGKTGLKVVTNYVRQHFREFWDLVQMDLVLNAIGGRLTTNEELTEFKAFKTQYVGVHMAFRPGMFLAEMNIRWNSKYLPQITEWFNNQKNSSAAI